MAIVAVISATNLIYHVVRKPTELLSPVSGAFNKSPAETWRHYAPLFREYSTASISSELLAAICSALNTPLSHVLGEVSDSFALAELQNESAVLTPAGAAPVGDGKRGLSELPAARAFGVRPELRVPAGHARGMDSEPVLRPVGVNEDHPAFDEVTRRVRDMTDMVPV